MKKNNLIKKLKKKFGNQCKEIFIERNLQLEKDVENFIQLLNEAHLSTVNSKLIFK